MSHGRRGPGRRAGARRRRRRPAASGPRPRGARPPGGPPGGSPAGRSGGPASSRPWARRARRRRRWWRWHQTLALPTSSSACRVRNGWSPRADALVGVEVVDEEVAAGQPQADLALLEAVAVTAGGDQGVLQGGAGPVDEPGLEQHLGMLEAEPGRDTAASIASAWRMSTSARGRSPSTKATTARLWRALNSWSRRRWCSTAMSRACSNSAAASAVSPRPRWALTEVEVQGPLLGRVERRLPAAHLFERRPGSPASRRPGRAACPPG